jgi:hypothetical protein
MTLIIIESDTSPLATLTLVEPPARPNTSPVVPTDATVASELLHVTERPDMVTPPSSSTLATSCTESPMLSTVWDALTITAPTFGPPGPVESLHASDNRIADIPAVR